MKVMTFNIQHALDFSKKIIDTDLFANVIIDNGADICGLHPGADHNGAIGINRQIRAGQAGDPCPLPPFPRHLLDIMEAVH